MNQVLERGVALPATPVEGGIKKLGVTVLIR